MTMGSDAWPCFASAKDQHLNRLDLMHRQVSVDPMLGNCSWTGKQVGTKTLAKQI
jgi:hypothetical protein